MNARLRLVILAVASAGILLFPRLTYASDPPPDHLVPPPIIGVNPSAERAEGALEEVGRAGTLTMPLVGELPSGLGSASLVQSPEYYILIELPVTHLPWEWTSVPVPMRWQPNDLDDVSCGVQALGMALDGLARKEGGAAPSSASLMGSLQDQGLMYDFGTGVEELAYAARQAGYPGSLPFHEWTLDDLRVELSEGRSPVLALGTSGEGQAGHFVTLTGLSDDGQWVTFNDPTLGPQVMAVDEFMRLWQAQGRSGMVAREELPPGMPDPMLPLLAGVAGMAGLLALGAQGQTRKGIGGKVDRGGGGGSTAKSPSATRAATPPPPPRTPAPPPAPTRRFDTEADSLPKKLVCESAPKFFIGAGPGPRPTATPFHDYNVTDVLKGGCYLAEKLDRVEPDPATVGTDVGVGKMVDDVARYAAAVSASTPIAAASLALVSAVKAFRDYVATPYNFACQRVARDGTYYNAVPLDKMAGAAAKRWDELPAAQKLVAATVGVVTIVVVVAVLPP